MINEKLNSRTKSIEHLPIETKVCHAASDYKNGLKYKDFADEYGGIDSLKNEFFVLLEKWEAA